MRTESERFFEKVDASGDCWVWTAAPNTYGYGRIEAKRSGRWTGVMAHRWIWEHLVGPIPDGMEIDHLCRNRACVNPDHLEVVTPAENARRGVKWQLGKSHCPQGHPYEGDNLYVCTRGRRNCRACRAIQLKHYRERMRSERGAA